MFIKNNKNIKYYKFIFIIVAFIFSVLFFCLYNSIIVNATEVTSSQGIQIAEWDSEKGEFKTDNYGNYIYGKAENSLSLKYEITSTNAICRGFSVYPADKGWLDQGLKVTIPDKINGKTVIIGDNAFEGQKYVYEFDLSNIENLGVASFRSCEMRLLKLSLATKVIPNYCFKNCSQLNYINIPCSVTTIGYAAFYNNGAYAINIGYDSNSTYNVYSNLSEIKIITSSNGSMATNPLWGYRTERITINNSLNGRHDDTFFATGVTKNTQKSYGWTGKYRIYKNVLYETNEEGRIRKILLYPIYHYTTKLTAAASLYYASRPNKEYSNNKYKLLGLTNSSGQKSLANKEVVLLDYVGADYSDAYCYASYWYLPSGKANIWSNYIRQAFYVPKRASSTECIKLPAYSFWEEESGETYENSGNPFGSFTVFSGITEIWDGCFKGVAFLSEVRIPITIKRIGEGAFQYSSMNTLSRKFFLKKITFYNGSGTNYSATIKNGKADWSQLVDALFYAVKENGLKLSGSNGMAMDIKDNDGLSGTYKKNTFFQDVLSKVVEKYYDGTFNFNLKTIDNAYSFGSTTEKNTFLNLVYENYLNSNIKKASSGAQEAFYGGDVKQSSDSTLNNSLGLYAWSAWTNAEQTSAITEIDTAYAVQSVPRKYFIVYDNSGSMTAYLENGVFTKNLVTHALVKQLTNAIFAANNNNYVGVTAAWREYSPEIDNDIYNKDTSKGLNIGSKDNPYLYAWRKIAKSNELSYRENDDGFISVNSTGSRDKANATITEYLNHMAGENPGDTNYYTPLRDVSNLINDANKIQKNEGKPVVIFISDGATTNFGCSGNSLSNYVSASSTQWKRGSTTDSDWFNGATPVVGGHAWDRFDGAQNEKDHAVAEITNLYNDNFRYKIETRSILMGSGNTNVNNLMKAFVGNKDANYAKISNQSDLSNKINNLALSLNGTVTLTNFIQDSNFKVLTKTRGNGQVVPAIEFLISDTANTPSPNAPSSLKISGDYRNDGTSWGFVSVGDSQYLDTVTFTSLHYKRKTLKEIEDDIKSKNADKTTAEKNEKIKKEIETIKGVYIPYWYNSNANRINRVRIRLVLRNEENTSTSLATNRDFFDSSDNTAKITPLAFGTNTPKSGTENYVASPELKRYGLTIQKTDVNGRKLENAEFNIKNSSGTTLKFKKVDNYYIYTEDTADYTTKLITDSDGQIKVYALPIATPANQDQTSETFTITETVAPSGYAKASAQKVTLGNDSTSMKTISFKDDFAYKSLALDKCFEVGNLSESEILAKAKTITLNVSGNRKGDNAPISKNYNVADTLELQDIQPAIDGRNYARFEGDVSLPVGTYNVSETINSNSFFDKTKAYMVETNHMSSVTDIVKNILSDISDGKTSNNIDITLTSSTSSRVFVFNGLKTTDLTIDKTTNCTNNYDYFNGYSFEIEGTDLLKQKFIWRIDSSGSVKKYFVDASGEEKEIKNQPQIEPFTYTLDAKVSNVIGMVYSLENIPYSANGYTVKEIISSNNFDASQTKVYDSEDYFYHDTNGRVRLSTKASASNGFYAGFRNIPVGSIKVKKTSEDGVVKGLKFTVREVSNTSKSYTAITDSSGIATFDNLPVFDINGNYIKYEITENTPIRYDTVTYKKETKNLPKGTASGYYLVGDLTVGSTVNISVENFLEKASLEINKFYNGAQKDNESSNYANIEFTLYQYQPNGKKTNQEYKVTTNSAGYAKIDNLPIFNSSNGVYCYQLVENPNVSKNYQVSYSFDSLSGPNASGKFYFSQSVKNKKICVNNVKKYDLIIEKRDAGTDEFLEGAKFKIYKVNSNGSEKVLYFNIGNSPSYSWPAASAQTGTTLVSSSSNPISISGLESGTYRIEEIEAPNNYDISEPSSQSITFDSTEGKTVTFYDKLKTQKVKIFKFADNYFTASTSGSMASCPNLLGTKFKISGTLLNGLDYENILTVDSNWKHRAVFIDHNYQRKVYGYYIELDLPYSDEYTIEEIEANSIYDLSKTTSRLISLVVPDSTDATWTKDDFFLQESSQSMTIAVNKNTIDNATCIFYNRVKHLPINIYKSVAAESLEDALAIAKGTTFKLSGGSEENIPSITTSVNGNISLNTADGWIQDDKTITGLPSAYCFKYTVDNVIATRTTSIEEFPGENCDETKVSACKVPNCVNATPLYDSASKSLNHYTFGDLYSDDTNRNVYFFNFPRRETLYLTKSANMFTAPDNLPAKITKEIILDSLNGIEFRISGTTYWGKEINLDIPIDNSWKVASNPNSKCYYMYTSVSDNLGKDLPLGNYTIKEVLPTNSEFVASKTMSRLYDVDPSKNPEALYENVKNDYTVSSSVSCDTTTGTKTTSFYNIKDYVKLTLNKYSDELYPHNGSGNFGLTDAINLLNGTKFLISGDTEADQEYSKEIIINEENKDLFRLLYDGSGFYLQYTMNIPRGNYTIKEVESPNYDLSKTTSIFKNMDNHASHTSNASLSFDLTNTTNQNSSNFSCSFNNFAFTTNLTIYKALDYTDFNYGSMLTDKDKQEIKDLFKDLKFNISCETFYGTDIKTLETNNQDDWKVDCYQGRPYIYQTVSVPIGTCTITETAADGTNTHEYFDLSKTSVAKNSMSGAVYSNNYSTSITETYTKDSKSSRICFANRLKTKQIKVALFGEGANSITSAKELLNNTQFEIKANSTISGVPYGARKITFNKNNLSDTLTVDTNNIKLETYTDNNSSTYAGFAYAEITVPEGNYSVTELSSNSVYDLSKTSYSWNAQNAISGSNVGTTYTKNVSSAANATAKTFSFYFYNRYALGDIVVEKIDSETKAPIKDVEFELRNKNFQVLKFKKDTTSTADNPVYILDETSGSSTLKTGNNGKFTVKDMPYGSYYVFETNPTENYVDSGNSAFISLTSPTVTKTIENTLKQETLRIVKAAEDIDEDTDDVNAVLKGLVFTIQGTKKNGEEYEKSITIDDNTSLTKSSINESSYVYFDVTVPVGQYTVSENTSNVKKYASGKICVADSVEKIIDKNSRTLGNSIDVTVNAINTNTEEDSNNSEVAATACFYNPLNYVKLQLYKYVPNVANMDKLKSLLSGTKFIIEGKNGSSYYQEYIIDKDNFIWVPADSKAMDGVSYKGYMLASYIVLPVGTYDVREIPNDNFDASKTRVGYALSHALANAPRTSFEITMTKTDTTYNRTFVNYPTTKTIRLAKVANNTFDSVANSNVRKYLEGIEFKFEDIIFGNNGYNETVTIDSSWTIEKSNGYKYLYKDIEVPVSSYTITETFGSNVYYDTELSETHHANTLAGVLDVSKRKRGRSATLNVTEGVEELYFFNTAKPTKLILSKAVEGNISYSSLFKLIAGTQFVITNKTTGFNTTITVPDKSSSIPDELGGTWGAWAFTGSDGKTYTRVHYVVTGLAPGNYEIKEIPNENFDPSRIYVSNSSANAIKNKTDNNPSDTYSFAMSKPFVEGDSNTTSYVTFLNTLDTKTIRVSKVANNTFANLQDSTILNYLNGLQFDINNTLISGEGFSKTVTIDNTWSVATSGHYKYAYKDIEVPAGIYTVEESIGSNTTFNAELAETYYQTSVENVLDETKRQQGTSGTINASDSSNEICFFNTAGPVKLVIYKAVQGSLSKTAMVDLVKGTKFEIKNNITNTLTTVTVGDDACGTVDEYGRKWGYFTKTGNDGNVYTLLQYVIEGFDPSQYNIKEIPNDNFIQSEIRVDTSLNVAIGSQPKDNIGFTAHKSTSTYSSIFLNTLANKTVRIYKFADNIKLNLSSKQIHSYLNGLEFNIKDTFFGEDKYNETVTIDDTWTVTPSNDYKYIYIYKDFELPASKYSITESIDLTKNIYYDPNGIYVAESFEDIVDSDKRTLGSSNEVSLINVENANAFFYNTQKSEGLSLQKYVPNIATTESMFNFVNGTKFVITGITDPSFKQEIVVSASTKNDWVYFPTTSSETNISYYGMKLKTPVKLPTGKYNVEEVPNDNTDVSKTRVSWSLVNAELDSSIRTSYPITILAKQTNTTAPYARYFINYPTTKTIRLAKVANNTFDSVADANVRKYLEGLEFKFEDQIFGDNGYNETITIDSSWTVGKSNGYKYLYKDIDVLASDYTITESIGDNIYYEGDSLKTYYSKTLKDVLDTSKRIQGNIASLNAADGETEVYFFNTAKPTKLALYKAVQGNMEYSSILKLVAGTKFVLTNKTTGSITTIVVPDKYNVTDEFGGKWGAYKTTLTTGETYTVMTYAVYGLEPGEYDIKEIPNENFNSSQIFVSSNLTKANENKTNGTSSDTYSFVMSKPFIETSDVSPIVFINTLDTKTIRISKVANNTFANLQTSTILNYLKGLQFDINNTLISGENFSKTVTIDDTWSVATSGNYKYAYKDIEVPAGIYAVEESIGSNTTFDAELTETYYQTSVENVLDTTKRQQGTLGAVTTSDGSNEICFFNTAGSVKLIIYKAVQGSLSKAAMVDLVKGTKFEIRNNITNDLTTVTVGEDACVTADEYGRKWGYFTKTGSDDNIYTLLQYVIEGFDPGQYNIKEIPNDNFVQSEIRVNTSLAVTIGSQPKDNINFTAHKPNTMSNATYSNLFLNTLATKTMRIVKLADNIYDTTTDANVRAYLNGLQFTITDNYFKDDGYSDTLTIDNTWNIAKDANNKVKYVYKDVEVPVSSYSIEETAGTNTMYDLTKTYNQRTLSDVLDTAKRTLGTKTTVNLANNEKDVYFYNSAKPCKFVLSKLVKGVKDETELRRLVNGTKFVLTNDRTAESVTYTIDSSWLFKTRSSSTGIVYGELYKTLNLDANKYTLKEVVNSNFEQDKIRIDWSVDKAEASEYRDTTTFTIVDPTKTLARYFINTQKTATIKLAKLADVTSSKISDDAVYKVLNGLDINVKSLNFNETYTIDNTWTLSSGNGYKYLYKEITVPYGAYTITETTGTNINFDMSNVYNSEALAKVVDTTQRSKGSSFKLIVDSASEKAYIYNTANLSNIKLTKVMDLTTEAYMRKVAEGTKFAITGTDYVGRSVDKTVTIDSNWKYYTVVVNSKEYSYMVYDEKVLPGNYTITETPTSFCDASKVTTGAGMGSAINSTKPSTSITLEATKTGVNYWRVFYNHLKETTLYLSKIGENINSEASYSETHKFLDGLQFKVSGNTALGEVYDKTFTINSDWYIGTAGKYRKLTYNLSLPYGSYTFTELSGSNNKYDLNKTKFAYNSTDILNEAVRKTGTSTSITISSTTSYGLVFLNVLKEKPEYSISDTTASTPDSSLTGTIETHVVNGAEESYNDGTDIPVIVIIKDKDGNEEIIATEEVDLKAGEEKDLTFSVIYPNDIKPEEYEIEVRINWDDKDKEQDPTNNTDSTVINPYDFAINKVGLKENKASVGGYIELVPEITYSGSKPFTDNNATLQFYVIDSSGNQVGDILSEIKLNSIKDLVDSDGNLNVPPNSTWTIGSDATPLSFLLPDDLVAGQTYQIRARVNWNNRFKELNPNNNEKEDNFSAVTKIDVKIKPNYPNSSYYAGTEVISTFTVDNVANNFNIIPKYLNVKFSVTALLPDGTIKDVPVDGDKLSIEKENVVPKKSTGIVYFKWKIPEKLSDGTSLVGATLNCKALLVANGYKDADPSNDTAVLSKKLYELPKSNVADTNYEENSQAAMDALKADHSAEGIKITNFVNKAISAMEHFDKVTTNKTEDSTTFQYKNLSSWEEWNYKGGKFAKNSYYAKLNDSVNIKADENYMVDGSSDDLTKFKSGYGFTVNAKANATKASARSLPENSYTNAQYSACFFPEYLFSDKKNEYETLVYNTTKKAFEIVNEKYSNSLHYTPIWYPDITTNTGNYPVAVEFTQCWTPAGVISSRKTNNSIKISGNIYEDWYQQQH